MTITSDVASVATAGTKVGRVRWTIVVMIFLVTIINYADRATMSVAKPEMSKEFSLNAAQMGWILSAFGWSYVICQIPGGWLLDRFGSKIVYFGSIFIWSLFTFMQGGLAGVTAGTALAILFVMRLLVGVAESPSFPGNARLVAAWFPANERGTASAIFNSAQYFATALFGPVMGAIALHYGWRAVFFFMGGLGIVFSFVWLKMIYSPRQHPRLTQPELDYIEKGGALVNMDQPKPAHPITRAELELDSVERGGLKTMSARAEDKGTPVQWGYIGQLLKNRMMVGVYLGQFCINCLTVFFATWFIPYLVEQRGLNILNAGFVASVPAICGFMGGVLGGIISDAMLRRGYSITAARKTPIVGGMLLATTLIICNYVDSYWLVVLVIAMSFFGKGIGALGWTVVSDTSPKEIAGVSGGLFNTFGNLSTITTPIVIGYIIQWTGSYNWALVFVGANAVIAVLSYLLLVGEIKRVELRKAEA
jgi:ACS family glucarate transporter-like MFS transporter